MPGTGKRGGTRVIYVDYLADGALLLVTMYAKNERADVPAHEIRRNM